jgi:type III pantothenate kinase
MAADNCCVLLTIDAGNTQTHVGLFEGERLVEHWRLATVREATTDELAVTLASLLELRGLELDGIDGAIASSVVPVLTVEYQRMSERYLGGGLVIVSPALKTGMPIRIDNPHQLGTDRLVNAVAAYEHCGGACIVVDFGTSLNYDVVSGGGEYLGGVISPGVEISADALWERAAKLIKVDIEPPEAVIGKSTEEAIRSGIVYGFAGQVDGIVGRLREELAEEATAIATGGHAEVIAPFCETIDEVDDLLTLTGLRLIHERNAGD